MSRRLALLVAVALFAAGFPAEARGPLGPTANSVGHGHPADCTEGALADALALGGAITFDCGAGPQFIIFSIAITITTTASLNGGDLITLSGNNATRLFDVQSGSNLTLSHITLSNAYVVGDGGAIYNEPGAVLAIDHATFHGNKTDDTHSGGAIINRGTLTISNSTFDSNSSGNGGALYSRFSPSSTTIADSLFLHNAALNTTNGWGGAMLIWDGAPVTVTSSQFISNTARWGGALYVFPNSRLTLTASLVADNLADGGASADGSGGGIYNNASLVMADTLLERNQVMAPVGVSYPGQRAGGAIYNADSGSMRMTGGALRGNRAQYGGGLYSFGNASLETVTLADNIAGTGGAIASVNGPMTITLSISGTTLSGNQASLAAYPAVVTPAGSAIYNANPLNATNTTLSGNSGAHAIDESNSSITLTSVTLAQNSDGALGSYPGSNSSQVRLFDTLLAYNGSANCDPSLFGTFTSQNSLSSDSSCTWIGIQNKSAVDPLLGSLGYHGGPTLTHVPAANSPAVDAGANCPATDQRGITRPQGPACDIGAVERLLHEPVAWLFLPLVRR